MPPPRRLAWFSVVQVASQSVDRVFPGPNGGHAYGAYPTDSGSEFRVLETDQKTEREKSVR